MKILLFPGTFDPMHFGHLRLLQHAIEEVKPGLSIIEVVAKSSLRKDRMSELVNRVCIARKAVDNTLPLPLSEMVLVDAVHTKLDIEENIHECWRKYPGSEVHVLLGPSGAKRATRWKSDLWRFVVSRDADEGDINILKAKKNVISFKVLPFKPSPITSQRVRTVLSEGKSPWRYVPRAVYRILEEKGLYGVKEKACLS